MKGEWIRKGTGRTTVVFVHGILSSGAACWRNSNGSYWPALLATEERLSTVGIYVFTYKTGVFSGRYRLGDVVDSLKEHLRLDDVLRSDQVIFVCHSMGGIVVRRFLVERHLDLANAKKKIGLFLIASPSLGSPYADWLRPLAFLMGHSQASALRFVRGNEGLMDLNKQFRNLKEARAVDLVGKELAEDKFITATAFWRRPVVESYSAEFFFGEPYKVPDSDHFSIAKPRDGKAIQHRLLIDFLEPFVAAEREVLQAELDHSVRLIPALGLPQLPERFVRRPEAIDRIRRGLTESNARVGLWGMAGCGKTVVATSIARDAVVVKRFGDGVLWVTVQRREPLAVLRSIVSKIEPDGAFVLPEDVLEAKNRVRDLLAGRQILLVLDDVWTQEQANILNVADRGAGVLATSRQEHILKQLGVQPTRIDELSETEAVAMLTSWGAPSHEVAAAIAAECGKLPLALAMAGALALRPNRNWDYVLRLLREARLDKFERLFSEYEHKTLLAAMQASIDDLDERQQHAYLDFAAFGSEWVPTSTLGLLWDDDDLVTEFVERSLAAIDDRGRVRLHDLQFDYVRFRTADAGPIHRRVVAAYRKKVPNDDFANATQANHDGWFFERLLYHLAAAGDIAELERLLFDFRWLLAKLSAIGADTLASDYELPAANKSALLARKAIRLAAPAAARDPSHLAGQLLARLRAESPEISTLLAGASTWGAGRPWLRPTRQGLQPAGGCLQEIFSTGSAVRRLVCRESRTLEAYCEDGQTYSWDVNSGSPLRSVTHDEPPPQEDGQGERTSPLGDDRVVRAAERSNGEGVIEVYDRLTGDLLFWMPCDCTVSHRALNILALDERRVLTTNYHAIAVWDLTSRTFVKMLEYSDQGSITCLTRIDNDRFACASTSGAVRVWDLSSAALAASASRHSQSIMDICATPRGIISSSFDDSVLQWSIEGDERPSVLIESNAGWVRSMRALDDNYIVAGSISNRIRLWQLHPPQCTEISTCEREFPHRPLDSGRFACRVVDEGFAVRDSRSVQLLASFDGKDINDLMLIDGEIWALTDTALLHWTGEKLRRKRCEWSLARFVPPRYICFLDNQRSLKAWDSVSDATVDIAPSADWLAPIADGLLCWHAGDARRVYDLHTHSLFAELPPGSSVKGVFGRTHAVVSSGDLVRVVSLRSGRVVADFRMDAEVTAVSVVSELALMAIGDSSGSMQILRFEPRE